MKLYNNIIIDGDFPPDTIDLRSREVIEVPYLKNKPKVIDISVERSFYRRFSDCGHRFKPHGTPPRSLRENPVFAPETPWKKGECTHYCEHVYSPAGILFSGGMWYDGKKEKCRMRYQAGFHGSIAYAESNDGLYFTRPACNIYGDTDIVFSRGEI